MEQYLSIYHAFSLYNQFPCNPALSVILPTQTHLAPSIAIPSLLETVYLSHWLSIGTQIPAPSRTIYLSIAYLSVQSRHSFLRT